MVFQPKIHAILFNFMIPKANEYAWSFQLMYVSLFVTIEIIILVKKLNSEGPLLGVHGTGTRLLDIHYSSPGKQYQSQLRGPASTGLVQAKALPLTRLISNVLLRLWGCHGRASFCC